MPMIIITSEIDVFLSCCIISGLRDTYQPKAHKVATIMIAPKMLRIIRLFIVISIPESSFSSIINVMLNIRNTFSALSRRLHTVLASKWFFYGLMVYLALSAFWVATSSLYPMAFDEDFHLGIIRLYAELWSPFAIQQAPEAAPYGSLVTDPSYLFHYLMSFPYRILSSFISSEVVVVIILRCLNIAFFVSGLFLYRKVLLRAKFSPAIVNAVFAVFVLIPVVPMLAGQINYDNLLMLIVAASFWLALRSKERLDNKEFPAVTLLWLVALLLVASVVKYAFLPIAVGIMLYLMILSGRMLCRKELTFKKAISDILSHSKLHLGVLFLSLLLGLVLCVQIYAVNVVKYRDLVPDCGAVITVEECSQYGPWGRDYRMNISKQGDAEMSAVKYTATSWLHGMWHRLYFAVAGSTNGFDTKKQLPVGSSVAIAVFAVGLLLFVLNAKKLFRRYPILVMFAVVTVLYVGAVWLQVYKLYLFTGHPVAINGRYLIPLLPAIGVALAVAYAYFFNKLGWKNVKIIFASVVIVLLMQGGGISTYIVRSQPEWYWPNSFMQDANMKLKKIISPITIGS